MQPTFMHKRKNYARERTNSVVSPFFPIFFLVHWVSRLFKSLAASKALKLHWLIGFFSLLLIDSATISWYPNIGKTLVIASYFYIRSRSVFYGLFNGCIHLFFPTRSCKTIFFNENNLFLNTFHTDQLPLPSIWLGK